MERIKGNLIQSFYHLKYKAWKSKESKLVHHLTELCSTLYSWQLNDSWFSCDIKKLKALSNASLCNPVIKWLPTLDPIKMTRRCEQNLIFKFIRACYTIFLPLQHIFVWGYIWVLHYPSSMEAWSRADHFISSWERIPPSSCFSSCPPLWEYARKELCGFFFCSP